MALRTQMLSLRLSETEYKEIKSRAIDAGVSIGRYMVNSSLSDEGVTIKTKQEIYRELLIIKDSATNKISSNRIIEGCENIWNFLK